jgi:hypothetical protein
MAAVMIGVDPHKGSHTAVVTGQAEMALGEVRVRASASQVRQLLAGAAAGAERTWAVEGAGGLGTCWPGSWPPRVSGCWMCSLSWPRGCGCWPPAM